MEIDSVRSTGSPGLHISTGRSLEGPLTSTYSFQVLPLFLLTPTLSTWPLLSVQKLWGLNSLGLCHSAHKVRSPGSSCTLWTRRLSPVCGSCSCCSVAQSCLTLCERMDCSTPGSPPSLSPGVCSTSCPLSWWCHPTISSSVIPFSSCLQSFPASGSFPVSQLFTSGGQNIGVSAWASVLPLNIQDWSPLGLTGLLSLQSKEHLRVFSNTIQKHQFISAQTSLWSSSHICTWLLEKPLLWQSDLYWQSDISAFQHTV